MIYDDITRMAPAHMELFVKLEAPGSVILAMLPDTGERDSDAV